ncbi:MAG: hypothetical protein Q9179_003936 [Wetmoreana sp. 5 TL-2023]
MLESTVLRNLFWTLVAYPATLVNGLLEDDDEANDACQSYAKCGASGNNYWQNLLSTIKQAQPVDRIHTKNPPDEDVFNADYHAEGQHIEEFGKGVRADLNAKGLDLSKMGLWAIWTVNATTGKDDDTAYLNIFDTANGVILAIENWRDRDSRKTLPWSEIMYQNWKQAEEAENYDVVYGYPAGHDISSLKYSIQNHVANKHAKRIIELAHKTMGYPLNGDDPTWRKWTDEDTPNWFRALLGTDNCKGTVWLLTDHAAEIGKKKVTEIWTRWNVPYPDICTSMTV